MRSETRRTLFRHALYIPPLEKIRVGFRVMRIHPPVVVAQFECLTCELPLRYCPESDYWVCPECEYELISKEARDLHDLMIFALEKLNPGTERSWLWALVNWLRKRLGRKQRCPKALPPPSPR